MITKIALAEDNFLLAKSVQERLSLYDEFEHAKKSIRTESDNFYRIRNRKRNFDILTIPKAKT